MAQFDPTAPHEERRRFYRELANDPDFQALSPEDRHDVAKRVLFPGEKEPSTLGRKIVEGAEKVVGIAAKTAPFPGLVKTIAGEPVPRVGERGPYPEMVDIGYLAQPLPEAVTEGFQAGVEGVRKAFGHEPAKLIEDIAGSAPFLPIHGLARNVRNLGIYGPRWRGERVSGFENLRDVTPTAPEALTGPVAPSPEVRPTPPIRRQIISPARASAEVFERRLAEEEALRQSPTGRVFLRRQLQAQSVPPESAIEIRPGAETAIAKPLPSRPGRKVKPRKTTIQAPTVAPAIEPPEPVGGLADPIQARLEALGIEVPSAETQPSEVQAPAVETGKAPETYQEPRLTAKEVVAKIEEQQDPEHFDKAKITKQVKKGGETYIKTEIDPNALKVPGEKSVEPGISAPQKGAVVVDDKGKVIDGRHRTVDAKKAGETKIEAYVPEESKLAPKTPEEYRASIDAAAKARKYEKGPVDLDMPATRRLGQKTRIEDTLLSDHFAIHKPLGTPPAGVKLTISHRGTGLRITDVKDISTAKRIVEQLETAPGTKWDFYKQKDMDPETARVGGMIAATQGNYMPEGITATIPGRLSAESAEAVKQPWEMTQDEWNASTRFYRSGGTKNAQLPTGERIILKKEATEKNFREVSADFLQMLRGQAVAGAVRQGKTIPPEVLADYPDLQTAIIAPGSTISPTAVEEGLPPRETLLAPKGEAVVGGIEGGVPYPISDPIQKRLESLGIDIPPEGGQITTRLPDAIEQRLRGLGIETEAASDLPRQPLPSPSGVDVREPAQPGTRAYAEGQAQGALGREGATGPQVGAPVEGEPGPLGGGGVRGDDVEDISPTGRPGDVGGAPAANEPPGEGGGLPIPEPGRGRGGEAGGREGRQALNHVLPRDRDWIPAGVKTRTKANLDAVRLVKQIEQEGRLATSEEKEVLAKYVGWGGLKPIFDEGKAAYRERPPYYPEQKQEAANWEREWGQLYDEAKSALTPEEWTRAAQSILNAHYTSREVINAMWEAVGRLGFQGGNALEPAVGIGHFIGLQPESSRSQTRWRAVEIDDISARIAAQLYPEARVEKTGFEKAKISPNSQDLIISNVPFLSISDTGRIDSRYPTMALHNYFIVRSLDLLKPGGMLVTITSDSTMDNASSKKAREIMAERADLVAAIRLPNTAFKKNAGTEVTTDILFFRKRDGLEFEGEGFIRTGKAETYKGEPIEINEYFVNHPDMMLGRMSLEGTMHQANEPALLPTPGANLSEQLREAVQKLPEKVLGARSIESEGEEAEYAEAGAKPGTLVVKNSLVRRVTPQGELEPLEWAKDKKKVSQAVRYIALRDDTAGLVTLEQSPDATESDIEGQRVKLNAAYNNYVQRYGPVNERKSKFLEDDEDFPRALSLEVPHTTVIQETRGDRTVIVRKTIWHRAAILDRRVNFPNPVPGHVDTIQDGLQVSLNYRGRVEPKYISELTSLPIDAVKAQLERLALAFENPKTGTWEPRSEYLSGNVKAKLADARAAAQDDPRFEKHAQELEAVQPAPVSIERIGFKLGSAWLPPEIIKQFIKETMEADTTVSLTPETGTWHVRPQYGAWNEANLTVWGIHQIPGHKLVESALNLKGPKVYRYETDAEGKERPVKDPAKTLEAEAKQQEIQDRFKQFVLSSPEASAETERIFNEKFNGFVEEKWEAPSWTHYPNASHEITLYPHQKTVSTRMIRNSTMLAHAVGTGKTFIMSTVAMELKRLGLANKSLIVAQNATVEQFARAFKRLYPNARVLAPSEKERSAKERNSLMARIATGDWDAIIVPQSFASRLPDNPARVRAFIKDRIAELRQSIIDTKRTEGKRAPAAADLQRALRKLENRLEKLADREVDNVLTFEQLEIDALFVDESHAYKKLEFDTKMENIKGLDKSFSQRGFSIYMKTRWVQEKRQGKNVFFATGTPVSNTMAEAWNIIRYVRPDLLKQFEVETFDQFASLFISPRTALEMGATGNFKMQTRLAKFSNKPTLMELWKAAADVVTADEVNAEGLPSVKGGGPRTISTEKTPELSEFIDKLNAMLDEFAKMSGREKRENSHIPLVVYGLARKASLDMRMIDHALPDQAGSKLNAAIREIKRIYDESTPVKGAQMAFMDLYQDDPDNPRFNAYQEIKRKLVKLGIPEREIIIITDDVEGPKREAVFKALNDGDIRVAIGSRERMGVGVDAQEHLIAVNQIDVPHRPMDLEQSNGRILRPGNSNPEVEILYYGVVGTLDAAQYDLIATKARWIAQLLKGNMPGFDFEDPFDEAILSFDQQMAALSGNAKAIQKIGLENDIRRLDSLRTGHIAQVRKARENLDRTLKQIPLAQQAIADANRKAEEFAQAFPPEGEIVAEIAGKSIVGKEVTHALTQYLEQKFKDVERLVKEKGMTGKVETSEFSEIRLNGKDLLMKVAGQGSSAVKFSDDAVVHWHLAGVDIRPGTARTGAGLFHGLTAQLEHVEKEPDRAMAQLRQLERDARNLSGFVQQPFQQEVELIDKKAKLAVLIQELKAESNPIISPQVIEATEIGMESGATGGEIGTGETQRTE